MRLHCVPISFAILLSVTACPSSERIQASYDVCQHRRDCAAGRFHPADGAECTEILNDPLPYLQCVSTAPCVLRDGGHAPDGGVSPSACGPGCVVDVSACSPE